MNELLTYKEVMAWLKISESTLYRLIKREVFHPIHLSGRSHLARIRKEEVERYIEERSHQT